MKNITIILALSFASLAYAGGTIGGGSGLTKDDLLDVADIGFSLETLPKAYLETEDFRRTKARLSVAGVDTVAARVDGEELQVRLLMSSIVDVGISKELLPE